MSNKSFTQPFNTRQFNESITEAVTASEATFHDYTKYKLEVRDKSGILKAYLPKFFNGTADRILNDIGDISFDYPASDSVINYLVFPYQVWVRDGMNNIFEKYIIIVSNKTMTSEGYVYHVEGKSLAWQLSKDIIVNYQTEEGDEEEIITVGQHIKSFLAAQNGNYQVSYGYIDGAISKLVRTIEFEADNILSAIKNVYDLVKIGYWYINPDTKKFYWKIKPGDVKGQEIRLRKNMMGISESIDPPFANRIYVYGNGELSLKDAGYGVEYKQNSSSVSQYGVISTYKRLTSVYTAQTLEDYANAFLKINSIPTKTIEIDCIALENASGYSYNFEQIELGSTIKVINEDLDIEETDIVMKIERDLDNSLIQTITISNKVPTLEDAYESLVELIKDNEDTHLELSDETPTECVIDSQFAIPGESFLASREDHVHALPEDLITQTELDDAINELEESFGDFGDYITLDDLIDDLQTDIELQGEIIDVVADAFDSSSPYQTVINNAVYNIKGDGVPAPVVSGTGGKGIQNTYAPFDHYHGGMPWTSAIFTTLSGVIKEGEIAYSTDRKEHYLKQDSSVNQIQTGATTEATLPTIPSYGCRIIYYDSQLWIAYVGQSEWTPMQYLTNTAGS